jgi:hypothetical protein
MINPVILWRLTSHKITGFLFYSLAGGYKFQPARMHGIGFQGWMVILAARVSSMAKEGV